MVLTSTPCIGQDRVKRVSKNPLLYLKGYLVSLLTQRDELECQTRENDDNRIRAGNDDGLFGQSSGYVSSKALSQAGCEFTELGCLFFLTQRSKLFGGRISLEKIEYCRMIQLWVEDAFQCRMYLS